MSQQTQSVGGEVNLKGVIAGYLVVVVLVTGVAGVADWAGWVSLSEVLLPF